MRGYLVLITSLALVPAELFGQGRILPAPCFPTITPIDARVMPPRPVVCGGQVVRVRSDVRAELVGSGATRVVRYEVDERFVNNGGRLGEADYVFPLPKGAAFQDLKLAINGELVSGETMNAADARGIYEEIVRRQRDPALVEWMGYGLLRARIFPINPGEEKRVVVRFQMVAEREGDAVRLDYFGGGADARQGAAPSSFVLTLPETSDLGVPYSPTHTLDVVDDGSQRTVRVNGDASDVTVLVPLRPRDEPAISLLANAPGGEDGFALIALAPPTVSHEEETPRDVTLVLDISGSMSGAKMEQARAAGRQLLHTLRIRDRFRLIDFSSDVHSFRDDFVPATAENLRAAEHYLDALEAQGATNISGALHEALGRHTSDGEDDDRRLSIVLFITDGEPTVGERDPARIADEAGRERRGTRVFTFGVGSDVNVTLLEQLALQGRGTAQFVRPDESVERAVGVVASRIAEPVLTDVRVHTDGGVRLAKVLPEQPLDLFAGQDLVLLARYAGRGPARVVFEGKRHGQTVRWSSAVNFPERDRDNPFVPRLWAAQRIGWLAAEKRTNGASAEIDEEIRTLGERFGIPTEFTSYFVQERGVVAAGGFGGLGGSRRGIAPAAAPAPSRDVMFERAKVASEQRAATSIAALDAVAVTSAGTGSAQLKRAGSRSFILRDSVWTDQSYVPGKSTVRTVRIKAYSPAYFDLMNALPALRPIFAVGDRLLVKGQRVLIQIGSEGLEQLSTSELDGVVRDW